MNSSNPAKPSIGPFLVLTFIYFLVGFLTTVNGQFQGPLKVAFLDHTVALKNTLTTLISFFFFLGYLLNSSLGGKWVDSKGYKQTLIRALEIMVAGLSMYALSSFASTHGGESGLQLGDDLIPYGFLVFLAGSFLMGTSAAILQVVINPYVAAYDLPQTSSVQRMNIVCAVNSLGTTVAPFFVTGVVFAGLPMEEVAADRLLQPFLVLALCIVLTTLVTRRLRLPDIANTRAEGGERLERSIWSFSHLRYGVLAIFFYVGTEVSIGVNINLHAQELVAKGESLSPALLATLYWGGFMVGRLAFSFFNNISPRKLLVATTLIAIVLLAIAIVTCNLLLLVSVGLCHSVMWSCIFTLSIKGLKKYTSKASGVFMMGVFGGAVFPVLQGALADMLGSWQWTWVIAIACEIVMLWYALIGSKVKDSYCLQ